MLIFGPIPSRRLGNSLGINHIPPKHCPYACVYCQVGRTNPMTIQRASFYTLEEILGQVEEKIARCSAQQIKIDYLSLVPDGEPTLDINLGKLIEALKQFHIPVAVISNSTLLDQQTVRDELSLADWVSLKVDSVDQSAWQKINRPHGKLSLPLILESMIRFREQYKGILVTETMLISGLNDSVSAANKLCDYLLALNPHKSYLAIPIRPPAESYVKAPAPQAMETFLQVCSSRISFMELLFETEIGSFISTGNLVDDILSITAVHPLREKALRELVAQAQEDWHIIEQLILENRISMIEYANENFYLRSH